MSDSIFMRSKSDGNTRDAPGAGAAVAIQPMVNWDRVGKSKRIEVNLPGRQ